MLEEAARHCPVQASLHPGAEVVLKVEFEDVLRMSLPGN
jgi:hypothetical protein